MDYNHTHRQLGLTWKHWLHWWDWLRSNLTLDILHRSPARLQFNNCYQYSLCHGVYPTVSQFHLKIQRPIHLIHAHLPLSSQLSPLSHTDVDTWSHLWDMYHTHLNGLTRLMDNNPLCFGVLCETLKSNLLADLLSRPAIGPPTSLPWWIVIVIEWLRGTSDNRRLCNFRLYWGGLHKRQIEVSLKWGLLWRCSNKLRCIQTLSTLGNKAINNKNMCQMNSS